MKYLRRASRGRSASYNRSSSQLLEYTGLQETHVEGDMLIIILHQQVNELFEERNRLYRFLLGPYIPACQQDSG
jgi:hypothetical protein